ncbi:hypothetical protein [Prosthecobacter sp.]|uniref:hypothetical protein n=1 Tax=Prosthecobacter sp. TaxID=1965333 RepID=UPI003783320B
MNRLLRAIAAFRAALREEVPPPSAEGAGGSSMGGWPPEARRETPKANPAYIAISLVVSALLITAVGGGLLWHFQRQQEQQARAAYAAAIERLWTENSLILDDSKKFLLDQPDLEEGEKRLKSHAQFFRATKQVLYSPDKETPLVLPSEKAEDLSKLKDLLDAWSALHAAPWKKLQAEADRATAESLYAAAHEWEQARHATWKQLRTFLDLQNLPLPPGTVVQPLKNIAKEALRRTEPDRYTCMQWSDLFDLMERQNSLMDPEARLWLRLWLDLGGPAYPAALEKIFADSSLPVWLRARALAVKTQKDKDGTDLQAEQNKETVPARPPEPPKPGVVFEDADAFPPTHDIHVLLFKFGEDLSGKIAGLNVAPDMQLLAGDAWDASPAPEGRTVIEKGRMNPMMPIRMGDKETLVFGASVVAQPNEFVRFSIVGTLRSIPDHYRMSDHGLRLVGRSNDGRQVLFDLRLIPARTVVTRPVFTQEIPATADNASSPTLRMPPGFIPRLHLLGMGDVVYCLRLDGTASEQRIFDLKLTADSSFEVVSPDAKSGLLGNLAQVRSKIAELEAGLQKDAADIAALATSKLSQAEKDARVGAYFNTQLQKENQLQSLRAQLQSLEGRQSPHFDLMPGHYTLLLDQPSGKYELCKLNVSPAAKPSTSKPSPL